MQTGPNGEVYVCWADYNGNAANDWTAKRLGFSRSLNGGITFTAAQRVINYTGIRQFNATKGDDENPLFNGIRVNDFPAMAIDKSTGTHRGRIYVVMPLRQNGNGKAVVQVNFSDNQGTSWSTGVVVSIANATQSFFPWISVDASTGLVYVIYYAFDQATGFSTNTYVATSTDGGATFTNQKVSSVCAHYRAYQRISLWLCWRLYRNYIFWAKGICGMDG
ncbi:MAG: exo-alpha-sialidase [Bacteroidetes bacterium]|nr:exo-alpha-sialidase [Bacteroidota bacterium]MBS1609426.1 exo-alpha-sialidase [Bacteroidota bacterium]